MQCQNRRPCEATLKNIVFAKNAYDFEIVGLALLALIGNLKTPYLIDFFQEHGLEKDQAKLSVELMSAGFSEERFSRAIKSVVDFNFKKRDQIKFSKSVLKAEEK